MSTNNFTLAEPISYSKRRVKSSFALTIVSALTLSVGTYSMSASTGGCSNPTIRNVLANESLCAVDNAMAALFTSEFSHKERMLKRLESLYADLQYENWDGYGAVPLERQAYENVKRIIESLSGSELKYWNLFPSPNGTLLLSAKNGDVASLSIGNNDFSYAALNDESEIMGKESFDAMRVVKVIENIHLLLDYNV